MAYVAGKIRAICDRCGFEYALSDLRKEWTGLMVCRDDYDPRPPKLTAPVVRAEGVPHPNARPDDTEVSQDENNTTTPADLM